MIRRYQEACSVLNTLYCIGSVIRYACCCVALGCFAMCYTKLHCRNDEKSIGCVVLCCIALQVWQEMHCYVEQISHWPTKTLWGASVADRVILQLHNAFNVMLCRTLQLHNIHRSVSCNIAMQYHVTQCNFTGQSMVMLQGNPVLCKIAIANVVLQCNCEKPVWRIVWYCNAILTI